MALTILDFYKPTSHPYGMLDGYKNAAEKESVLALILMACIESGGFVPVKTKYNHPSMVNDGLLEETKSGYMLTTKSIGLLFSVFGKVAPSLDAKGEPVKEPAKEA